MKAAYIDSHGNPEVIKYTENFEVPVVPENYALIKIKAASINRVDGVVRNGYPGIGTRFPFLLGGDIAGVVENINAVGTKWKTGDEVIVYPVVLPVSRDPKFAGNEFLNDGWQYFGMHRNGAYAEYIAVPLENLFPKPVNLTFEEASCLPIAGLTAWHALEGVGKLQKDDTFFIWGGSGGMGSLAVQIAKSRGAIVIATAGNIDKMNLLKQLGTDYVFNHYNHDIPNEVLKLFPKGCDLVIDYVGPATFDQSFKIVRKAGKIILCGMLTGMNINLNIQQTYFRHISIHGIYLGSMNEFSELLSFVDNNHIKPVIHDTFSLKDAKKAHDLLELHEYKGKLVLVP